MTTENTTNEVPVDTATETFLNLAEEIKVDVATLKNELTANKGLSKFVEGEQFNLTKAFKSLTNAEKLIGKRIEEADAETIKTITGKFGVPADITEYEITGHGIDDAKKTELATLAKTAGVSKEAAKILFAELFKAPDEAAMVLAEKEKISKELEAIRAAFGEELDTKKEAANKVLEMFGSDDLKKQIAITGLGTNVEFLKFLSNVGTKFQSKDITTGPAAPAPVTAESLRSEAVRLMASPAYSNHLLPDHAETVAKVQSIYNKMYEK